eukprot:m.243367 g.243367  ORF g.243367 m.243367 type:complete len:902 (+) comp40238_c0_seq13:76-2781(+)
MSGFRRQEGDRRQAGPPSGGRKRTGQDPPSPQSRQTAKRSAAGSSPDLPPGGSGSLPLASGQQQGGGTTMQSHQFPARPGFGTFGRVIPLRANRFRLTLPRKLLYHYDVSISPESISSSLNTKVIVALGSHCRAALGGALPVYDGKANMYTARRLPLGPSDEGKYEVPLKIDPWRPEKTFKVMIKLVAALDLTILQSAIEGKSPEIPFNVLQALEVVTHMSATLKMISVGRSFFPPLESGAMGRPFDLGGGCELWLGYHQSVRTSMWGADVNIDMAATAFYKEQEVLDFLVQSLNVDRVPNSLNEQQRIQFNKEMKGLRVQVTHMGNQKRKYRVNEVTMNPASTQTFPMDKEDGSKVDFPVARYFHEKYHLSLRFPNLNCLHVGPKEKSIYLPLEVCRIAGGQRCVGKLTDRQKADMIRNTAKPAFEREGRIRDIVSKLKFTEDVYMKEFGLNVHPRMCELQGRVLPPPDLKFGKDGEHRPDKGQWDMRGKSFVKGAQVQGWAILVFAPQRYFDQRAVGKFVSQLQRISSEVDMAIRSQPGMVDYGRSLSDATRLFHAAKTRVKGLNLIVVVSSSDKFVYGEIKRIGDLECGIATQFIKSKNAQDCRPQVLSNICLKINLKLGGINNILSKGIRVPAMKSPIIFLGADVSHPGARDDRPSVAAVVGSINEHATEYRAKVCVQRSREEVILGMEDMAKALLLDFYRATRCKPNKIVYYRDGVSDGQFAAVVASELTAIKKACIALEATYSPAITFVVVQKKHHTRFFAANRQDQVGKAGNVPPGTVVDKSVVHPTQNDFYLCSHFGIQGTSRPSHYHVLWDENGFGSDELHTMTYHLCHTYSRCNRAVSVPAPVYYADLAAGRTRQHMDADPSIGAIRAQSDGSVKSWTNVEIHRDCKMYFA